MPQAIVDPAELRRFAQMLKKFNNELGERMSAMANQLNDLTNSWRDQEQIKFRTEFEGHMKMIARFIEANNQHIPYLLRKAERIEEYMQQRETTTRPGAPEFTDPAEKQICRSQKAEQEKPGGLHPPLE